MTLNIFFCNKTERLQFLGERFHIDPSLFKNGGTIINPFEGIKSIKLKNKYMNIPGFWMEVYFLENKSGKRLHEDVKNTLNSNHINENVFYPVSNGLSKDLEAKWINKYDLLNREKNDEVWKLFLQEIKSHMQNDRIDIAYKGFVVFLRHNPFFLKKYKRFYILEDLAYFYEDAGNVGKAVKCLKMQAVLNPDSVEPYLNMSSFYIINGMEEEAFNTCKKALQKSPENQFLISNLIISLINLGNYEYAITYLENILKTYPKNPYFWKLMGDVLYEVENNEVAIDSYKRALKLEKAPFVDDFKIDVYTAIADCHYEEENYVEAANNYRRALKYNPMDPYLLMSLGQIYFFKIKDAKAAYKYTKLLVDNIPDNGYAQFQLGLIHCRLENFEKATWHLYKARSIIPYYKPIHDAIYMIRKNKTKELMLNQG